MKADATPDLSHVTILPKDDLRPVLNAAIADVREKHDRNIETVTLLENHISALWRKNLPGFAAIYDLDLAEEVREHGAEEVRDLVSNLVLCRDEREVWRLLDLHNGKDGE